MTIKKETKIKLYLALGLTVFLSLLLLFVFSGDNFDLLKSIFVDHLSNDELRDKLNDFGWRGYITIVILAALQVVCAFLPAEPVQVLSGVTFGFLVGLLCCMIGVFIGNTLIYLLHKTFGDKLRGFFVKKLGLDLEKIAHSNKLVLIIFILYFLPAIPYGMICFFAATTNMRYRRYITITLLGAFPSVCIGVGLGHIAIVSNWIVTVCIFAVLIALLIVLYLKRDFFFTKLNNFAEESKSKSKTSVRKTNRFMLDVLYFTIRFYYYICGVHIKSVNKVGKLQGPAIVLCSHGSFIDFIFSASLLRKFSPNFIVARLYFYDRVLNWLIRSIGGFPKSMFAMDTESTKNCIRVLKNDGILGMMPEARLSTTGRFEDIQKSTFSFIKKSGVPVYTILFNGDYLADPKWGKGFRRGSVVEATLDILYTADEVAKLSVEEIEKGITERLYYNEFEWLESRPNLKYRSRRIAEGLENILNTCPKCHKKHTLITKKDKVFCEDCGYLTSLDNRYSFDEDFTFKNLAEWYDWQKAEMLEEITENENFSLSCEVELRLPSSGRGLTRQAGKGVCKLSRSGLEYSGSKDGEDFEIQFPIERVYRLLFGAGQNFEIYNGTEILFFVPQDKRSCVDWYIASMLLYDTTVKDM
ncbi:MAG: VTT domain-containing protein [Clostridia bacterium]|nr:VTT domain-containing protein [Clostridia bacterium]MBR6509907.1 VTT domain-containing protein [Clostridia bacterium]